MIEYNGAVQNPAQAFCNAELKQGSPRLNNLGLPIVMSGGFALTYEVSTQRKKYAVRCFHREIPSLEKKYDLISKKLTSLRSQYFVEFDFQAQGIKVLQNTYPIVKMDWVEGDPLGIWLDKNNSKISAIQSARTQFRVISLFLEKEGIAHGDIQNGNVMMTPGGAKLIDYDGMFVPGMPKGNGSETGHKHFQHRRRSASDFGPKMDRFSFIAVDLSLFAIAEDKTLHARYRDGGETIIFTANDFADPQNSEIFKILFTKSKLREFACNFASICEADISVVPTLEDFLNGKNIPAVRPQIVQTASVPRRPTTYISAFPVVDALDFGSAERHVGDKIELIGKIVEVKADVGRRGKGKDKPFVFINFGPWRGSIVKISIWSEGLDKLKEKPSASWVGRWVSVKGLLDPPYRSRRYGYIHLSVTVQEDGQIQRLEESQAKFRLLGVGRPTTAQAAPSTTRIDAPPSDSSKTAKTVSTNKTKSTSASKPISNSDILKQFAKSTPSLTNTKAPPAPRPQSWIGMRQSTHQQTPQTFLGKIPMWGWAVAALVLFAIVSDNLSSPKQGARLPSSSDRAAPPILAVPQNQNRASRVAEQPSVSPGKKTNESTTTPFSAFPRYNPPPTAAPYPSIAAPIEAQPYPPPIYFRPDELPPFQRADSDSITAKPAQPPPIPSVPPPLPPPTDMKPYDPALTQPIESAPFDNSLSGLLDVTKADDARHIQQRLSQLGTYSGEVTGIWSLQAQQALNDFQMANGLPRSRVLTKEAQKRLFASTAVQVSATNVTTYAGEWASASSQCLQGTVSDRPVTSITQMRAEAFGTTCDFNSIERESAAWRIRARCTQDNNTWNANIRFLRAGNKLIWSSERGIATYVQCVGTR